jgi:hypothetical protein
MRNRIAWDSWVGRLVEKERSVAAPEDKSASGELHRIAPNCSIFHMYRGAVL